MTTDEIIEVVANEFGTTPAKILAKDCPDHVLSAAICYICKEVQASGAMKLFGLPRAKIHEHYGSWLNDGKKSYKDAYARIYLKLGKNISVTTKNGSMLDFLTFEDFEQANNWLWRNKQTKFEIW